MKDEIGSKSWNDEMYEKHPTPYSGIAGFIQRKRLGRIMNAIRKYRPSTDTELIMEIGCEEGHLIEHIHQQLTGYQLLGLDISTKALEQAQKTRPKDIRFDQWDITQGAYQLDHSPAYVICSETLEHIPDATAAVQGIADTAAADSVVIITVPIEGYKNSIKTWLTRFGVFDLFFKGIEKSLSEWHVQDFSKEDILTLLSVHFEVLHYETIYLMHQLIVVKKKKR